MRDKNENLEKSLSSLEDLIYVLETHRLINKSISSFLRESYRNIDLFRKNKKNLVLNQLDILLDFLVNDLKEEIVTNIKNRPQFKLIERLSNLSLDRGNLSKRAVINFRDLCFNLEDVIVSLNRAGEDIGLLERSLTKIFEDGISLLKSESISRRSYQSVRDNLERFINALASYISEISEKIVLSIRDEILEV